MRRGWVDPNLDDAAFSEGRVALSWSGHWDFPRYVEALGDDLIVLPLPDFGHGTRTGQGSWVWAVLSATSRAPAAAELVSFLLRPEEVLAMAEANGAVPGTREAAERSRRYGPGGPLRLILRQLEGDWAVARPRTPAYPFVSSVFQEVFDAVRNGEDPALVLRDAAARIDREIEGNRGYPST
jgi:multiple sugar transport system substrate-binding protein